MLIGYIVGLHFFASLLVQTPGFFGKNLLDTMGTFVEEWQQVRPHTPQDSQDKLTVLAFIETLFSILLALFTTCLLSLKKTQLILSV